MNLSQSGARKNLIIGFAELERQRAAEGRAVAAESGKKGGKRKKKLRACASGPAKRVAFQPYRSR